VNNAKKKSASDEATEEMGKPFALSMKRTFGELMSIDSKHWTVNGKNATIEVDGAVGIIKPHHFDLGERPVLKENSRFRAWATAFGLPEEIISWLCYPGCPLDADPSRRGDQDSCSYCLGRCSSWGD
jgi:hypothetical protein